MLGLADFFGQICVLCQVLLAVTLQELMVGGRASQHQSLLQYGTVVKWEF